MNKEYERHKKYRLEHLELYNKSSKKWYQKNKELVKSRRKLYRAKNKEKIALAQKEWRRKNGKKFDREWYAKNRDKQLIRTRKYRLENRDKVENTRLIRLYGITFEQYNNLRIKQKYLCAICGKKKKLVVDHCHTNNKVRGLLCHSCNSAIGQLLDDASILSKAIIYLNKGDV